jgi:zinc/manganese transport system permease protein
MPIATSDSPEIRYGFYLGSLALGVTLISLRGSSVDLLHVLFGSLLAVHLPCARRKSLSKASITSGR